MGAHSPYGPSSLSKRAGCPGSAAEEAGLEEDEEFDEYRDSGVVCHAAMEALVRGTTPPDLGAEEFKLVKIAIDRANAALAGDRIIPGEMRTEMGGIILCEERFENLPYSLPGDPQVGTLDLGVWYKGSHILLLDWKFGGSFVPHPKWNQQMKAYATGLWKFIEQVPVNVAIVQPQASNEYQMNPWVYDSSDYVPFCKELRAIVVACQDPAAPRCVGKACQFCKAAKANTCVTRLSALGALASLGADWKEGYRNLDSLERGRILTAMKAAIRAAEGVIEFSKEMIREDGESPIGWSASPTAGSKGTLRLAPRPSQPSWPADAPKIRVA